MYWSRFNFLLDNKEKKYLYNSYSNCLLELEEDLYNLFCSLQIKKNIIDNYISDSLNKEELEYLRNNSIIVENDDELVDILHMNSLARLFSRKNLVLIVAPTQSCNFACTYCYEKWRKSEPMSQNTEDAIVGYVRNQIQTNGLESLHLNWYGGEPLLQYEKIISLSNRLAALGIPIKENLLITNGFFFTFEIIEKLVFAGIKEVQITLDGKKDIHNSRRPKINGEGTFDTIIKNLDDYFNSPYKDSFTIALRVNIDSRNYTDFIELYKWLNQRYKSEKLIIYPGIIVLDEEEKKKPICLSQNDVTDLFLGLYKKYGIMVEKLYPDDIEFECSARSLYGSMLIGPNGDIYKCFEELGDKSKIVGNINESKIWNNYSLQAKYLVGIDHYNDNECRKCSYLPICRGGCPIRRFENVYMKKHNYCCTPFKGRINEYIDLYLNIVNKH